MTHMLRVVFEKKTTFCSVMTIISWAEVYTKIYKKYTKYQAAGPVSGCSGVLEQTNAALSPK